MLDLVVIRLNAHSSDLAVRTPPSALIRPIKLFLAIGGLQSFNSGRPLDNLDLCFSQLLFIIQTLVNNLILRLIAVVQDIRAVNFIIDFLDWPILVNLVALVYLGHIRWVDVAILLLVNQVGDYRLVY